MDAIDKALFSKQVRRCAMQLGPGGGDALGQLFDLAAPRLVRYATLLTRNLHDAEDALQAALVRIALHPESLAGAWHPWAYFLKVVRNEALKITGRRKRAEWLSGAVEPAAEDRALLDDDESRRFVQAALQQLPPPQAEVIVLKIWEEMTFEEIGEVLGESQNTVASRYRYGLQKLTKHLQPLADEVPHE